jgi:hypothetical protein
MLKFHASIVLCLGLAACGGGGGGGIAPIITSSNYLTVAQQALSSTKYFLSSGSFASGTPATGVQAPIAPVQQGLGAIPRQLAAGTQSQTIACPVGGTMSVTATDANGNGVFDAGDSFSMAMAHCQYAAESLDGALGVSVNSLSGAINSNVYALGASMSLTQLTISTAAVTTSGSGSIGLSLNSRGLNDQTLTITVPNFVTTSTYANVSDSVTLTSFSIMQTLTPLAAGVSSSYSASGSFASSAFNNNPLTIASVIPFYQSSGQNYPASGQMIISDATNRKVRITAVDSTRVQIEVDAGANGIYDLSVTKLWSELL